MHDGPRKGRARKVGKAAAERAAALLAAPEDQPGWPLNGYSSVADACARCPELEDIRLAAGKGKGCSHKTLWRAAKRVDPLLRLQKVPLKPPLSAVNRQKRLEHATRSLRKWRESRLYYQ